MPVDKEITAQAGTTSVAQTTSVSPLARKPIQLTVKSGEPGAQRTAVLVTGAFADGTLCSAAQAIDAASKGRLAALVKQGDLKSKPGSSLMLYDLPGTGRSGCC